MSLSSHEIRIKLALAKIVGAFNTDEGEFSSTLFVSHHLEECEEKYWLENFGATNPKPLDILSGLVLVDSWDSEGDSVVDTYDFSLPNNVTHYLLSVRFDTDNQITDFNMES